MIHLMQYARFRVACGVLSAVVVGETATVEVSVSVSVTVAVTVLTVGDAADVSSPEPHPATRIITDTTPSTAANRTFIT